MFELLLPIIALALAAAFQPLQVIALVVFLQTERGKINALAYVGGMSAFRLVLGLTLWMLVSRIEAVIESAGGDFDILVGGILAVLGSLMWVYALRRSLSAPDEDDAAASWLAKLDAVTPIQAALVGIAFLALDPRDWLIDLSAIDLIAEADLSVSTSLMAYLVYILLAQMLLLIALIMDFVFPNRSKDALSALSDWMGQHERSIEIGVAALFGTIILYSGLEHLGLFL